MIQAADRPAPTVAAAQDRLLGRLLTAVFDGRPVVVLAADDAPLPAGLAADERTVRGLPGVDGPLDRIVPGESAVLWLEAAGVERDGPLLAVLAAAATAGSPVLVVLSGSGDDAADGEAAAQLAAALPAGRVLEQRAVEIVVLAEAGTVAVPGDVPEETSRVTARLVCCLPGGGTPQLAALIEPVSTGIREAQLTVLERTVAELRTANVRLAREHLGRYDSAAASAVHTLEERYQREREIAIENDRLYQEVRRRLQQPHHVALDRLVMFVKRIPGGRRLVRLLRRGG